MCHILKKVLKLSCLRPGLEQMMKQIKVAMATNVGRVMGLFFCLLGVVVVYTWEGRERGDVK